MRVLWHRDFIGIRMALSLQHSHYRRRHPQHYRYHHHPHSLPHHHRRRLRPHRYIIISLPKASSSASYAGGYQVTSCPCHCRHQCHYLYLYHLGSRAT